MDDGTANQMELLRTFLAPRDVPCPSCGYNLRGLNSSTCPECRQALALRVNLAEPRLGAWVCGLVGLAAGAGFSGLLFVYVLWVWRIVQGGAIHMPYVVVTAAGLLVEGLLLLAWLGCGRAIRRLPVRKQVMLALCCWVITAGNLLVFCQQAA